MWSVQILADLPNLKDSRKRRTFSRKDWATKTYGATDAPWNVATHQILKASAWPQKCLTQSFIFLTTAATFSPLCVEAFYFMPHWAPCGSKFGTSSLASLDLFLFVFYPSPHYYWEDEEQPQRRWINSSPGSSLPHCTQVIQSIHRIHLCFRVTYCVARGGNAPEVGSLSSVRRGCRLRTVLSHREHAQRRTRSRQPNSRRAALPRLTKQ